jgi:hypothetical protein
MSDFDHDNDGQHGKKDGHSRSESSATSNSNGSKTI